MAVVQGEIVMAGYGHFAYLWKEMTSDDKLILAMLAAALRQGSEWATPAEVLQILTSSGDGTIARDRLIDSLQHLVAAEVLEFRAHYLPLCYRFQL